jgi:hypothetical protein
MTTEQRWGEIFYWAATFVAVLLVAWVVLSYVTNSERGFPIIRLVPLGLAIVVWLVGRVCRYVLGGR